MPTNNTSTQRVIMASILAPLIAPVLFFCCLLVWDAFSSNSLVGYGRGSFFLALIIGGPIAYLNILVIVVSIWLIAGKHALSRLWLLAAAGTISGALTILIMGGMRMNPTYYAVIGLGGFVGFVSAVIFWAIAHSRNSTVSSPI